MKIEFTNEARGKGRMGAEALRGGRVWRGMASALIGAMCAATNGWAGDASQSWGADIESSSSNPQKAPRPSKRTSKGQEKSGPANEARTLGFSGDATRTFVKVALTQDVPVEVFTLADPFRVIIELPNTTFPVAVPPGTKGRGLVESYRNGVFQAGKGRIVLETLGPVRAIAFPLSPRQEADGKILEVALTPMPVAEFGKGTGGDRAISEAAAAETENISQSPAAPPPSRPVIVIDPGHGGIDPGAVGEGMLLEKNIVFSVAQKLQAALSAKQRYDVHLTRSSDVFVSLDERVAHSRKNAANLFISIHADSIEESSQAQKVSGATVYTLSERASDEQSRRMAEKENASDLLAGLAVKQSGDDEVAGILYDLLKRETASFSAEFSGVLLGKLRPSIELARKPNRSAAFKVLKQTHAPSVLIELGYMSNDKEAKRLNSPEWQGLFAEQVAIAIDAYFASRTAHSR